MRARERVSERERASERERERESMGVSGDGWKGMKVEAGEVARLGRECE